MQTAEQARNVSLEAFKIAVPNMTDDQVYKLTWMLDAFIANVQPLAREEVSDFMDELMGEL